MRLWITMSGTSGGISRLEEDSPYNGLAMSPAARISSRQSSVDVGEPFSSAWQSLQSPDPAIALWLCNLDLNTAPTAMCAQWLSTAEHARAARFGTDLLRRRWMAGRAALRFLLGNALGIDPRAVQLRHGLRGRPEIATADAPDFNVSHTGDIALIGIGAGLRRGERIGVDIERADRSVNADGLARKFLGERERAALAPLDADARRLRFLRLWTCKEALSKATGDALSAPFRELELTLDEGPRLVAGPEPYAPERWHLHAIAVPTDLIATVALWRGRD
jgi:4'-phosphopantetheinyl transferase